MSVNGTNPHYGSTRSLQALNNPLNTLPIAKNEPTESDNLQENFYKAIGTAAALIIFTASTYITGYMTQASWRYFMIISTAPLSSLLVLVYAASLNRKINQINNSSHKLETA